MARAVARVKPSTQSLGMTRLALALAFACLGGSASAQDDATQARALFERGLALAEVGRDAEAATTFEASFALVPRPSTALNWAIVLDRTGRGRDALRALDAFEAARAEASAEDVADAEALRSRLRGLLATLTLRLDADASVEVDGRLEPGTGEVRRLALDPGPHIVRVEAPGRVPRRLSITVSAGEERSERVVLQDVAPGSVAPEAVPPSDSPTESMAAERDRRPLRRGLAVAGVVAAIAIVVGVVFASTRPEGASGGDTGVVLRPFD